MLLSVNLLLQNKNAVLLLILLLQQLLHLLGIISSNACE